MELELDRNLRPLPTAVDRAHEITHAGEGGRLLCDIRADSREQFRRACCGRAIDEKVVELQHLWIGDRGDEPLNLWS